MSGPWKPASKQSSPRYRGWTFIGDKMVPISRKGKLLMKKGVKIEMPVDPEPLDEEISQNLP